MLSMPRESWVIDDYKTKNLNKAAFLLTKGATYKDLIINPDGINTFVLDGVNRRHVDEFWHDGLVLEFWEFQRKRIWLKEQIKAKTEEK